MAHPQGTVEDRERVSPRGPRGVHDNLLAFTALGLGAISLVTAFMPTVFWLALATGVLGLATGAVAGRRAAAENNTGRLVSWTAVALSVAGIVLGILSLTVLGGVFDEVERTPFEIENQDEPLDEGPEEIDRIGDG